MRILRSLVPVAAVALIVTACTSPDVTVNPVLGQASGGLPPGISVAGQGEVTGAPDTLSMTFGVSVLRPSVSQAVADAAVRAQSVIDSLRANGVAEEDLQTANYSIFPEYNFTDTGQELVGYRVDNSVTAKIHDLAAAGGVIDAVVAAGGDEVRVHGVSFSIEDDVELLQAAREAAWADARAKAEQLAALAGVSLGEPLAISESLIMAPPVPFAFDAVAEAVETPIVPGQQGVTVNLSVEFAIQPSG